MKTKSILLVASLSICALAVAAEYKTPSVGFKETAPSHKETKMAEFEEGYKVEEAVKADRQIASENDSSEREPSSVTASDKKPVEDDAMKADEKFEPKPWLYRNKLDSAY